MGSDDPPEATPDETAEESIETESNSTEDQSAGQPGGLPVSRRGTLASLVGIGGLGLASSTAGAAKVKMWKKDRDAQGNDLVNLGTLTMLDNTTGIRDFEGANLAIDGDSVLNADTWDTPVDAGGEDLTNLGTASAAEVDTDHLSDSGSGDVNLLTGIDAAGNDLFDLGGLRMKGKSTAINDFEGIGLSVDGSGILNVTVTDTDTHTLVSDSDGDPDDVEASDIEFGTNLTVTDHGGGSLTVDGSDASPWEDIDSDNLLEASGFDGIDVDFVKTPKFGTKSNTVLEGEVGGERFLRVVPTNTAEAPDILAGHPSNSVGSGVHGATIAGGGQNSTPNTVGGDYGTVSGGTDNTASGYGATVSGGSTNTADANSATVVGGQNNTAAANWSVAAGRYATAQDPGSFVFGDSSTTSISSNTSDAAWWQMPINIESGGSAGDGLRVYNMAESSQDGIRLARSDSKYWDIDVGPYDLQFNFNDNLVAFIDDVDGTYHATSDRRLKENINPVGSTLQDVMELDVVSFEFIDGDDDEPSIGLIGQDAAENFPELVGQEGDDGYFAVNYAGFSTVAIKAIQEQQEEIGELQEAKEANEERIDDLENRITEKDKRVEDLEAENEQLRERLVAVEDRLADVEIGETTPASADD